MQIQGSVAFVTGANRGLGRHLAQQLVARGAKVYAAARNPETITLDGVIPVRIDITDPATIAAASEIARDTTLLVNNAGTASYNGLLEGPLDDIRAQMESHYFGTLAVTRAFAPHLIANAPGAVLNVASVLSWIHPAGIGAYSAAKAALWAQTDAVREELAPKNVAVTALHVGYMDTDMTAGVDAPKADPAQVAAAALDGVEAGLVEVLGDDLTRQVKAGLSADRGAVTV
ncbi:SDR family oxidoreductase [Mycolicibacterium wolinskyi]|uniref:Short-chain dehydrogenase n=1 Tax=Mycolicibacterium wolinskyi TaxID=59750 RepID=A0A1X2FAU2_9MYCO|nr:MULTISPECIES: SDR family oxidoreductase [Mycolicibacterium]MCV7285627.1 SDR family oxidoreductase [Mycolicibacterium wolinskyi]MCV7291342.1 SDR family oxidoreductase [Mycolicibacterium goodii]ORX15561.1 short-chain dehydrogenase [Mycolicibacterium wolinskyi]